MFLIQNTIIKLFYSGHIACFSPWGPSDPMVQTMWLVSWYQSRIKLDLNDCGIWVVVWEIDLDVGEWSNFAMLQWMYRSPHSLCPNKTTPQHSYNFSRGHFNADKFLQVLYSKNNRNIGDCRINLFVSEVIWCFEVISDGW